MLKTILISFIFLSILSCTGGSADKSSGNEKADSGRPSGGTEGIPGYVIAPERIKARYTADRVTVEGPAGVVVSGSKPMKELRITVITAPVQALNDIAGAPAGSTVSIAGAAALGSVTPNADGSFSAEFARPSADKEAIAVVIGSSTSNGAVIVSDKENAFTAVTQLISSDDGESSFVSVTAPNAPKVLISSEATSVTQSYYGSSGHAWNNLDNAKTPDGNAAVVNNYDGDSSNALFLKGFFSSGVQSLAASAVIKGAVVNCKWKGGDPANQILETMQLLRDGSAQGINRGTGTPLTTALALSSDYGSANDTWGLALTASDINRSDFGVAIKFQDGGAVNGLISIDHCQMKVYYTLANAYAQAPNSPIVSSTASTAISLLANPVALWSTPVNSINDNGISTTSSSGNGGTDYLRIQGYFSGANPQIPLGVKVQGIEVSCKWAGDAATHVKLRMLKNGSVVDDAATNKWVTVALSGNLSDSRSFGGMYDLWGETWTPEDINSPGFGFDLLLARYDVVSTWLYVELDSCQMKVYFSAN